MRPARQYPDKTSYRMAAKSKRKTPATIPTTTKDEERNNGSFAAVPNNSKREITEERRLRLCLLPLGHFLFLLILFRWLNNAFPCFVKLHVPTINNISVHSRVCHCCFA